YGRVTPDHARWKTTSGAAATIAGPARSMSARSAWIRLIFGSTSVSRHVSLLGRTEPVTSWPRCRSTRTRCEPRWPDAPVTKQRMSDSRQLMQRVDHELDLFAGKSRIHADPKDA